MSGQDPTKIIQRSPAHTPLMTPFGAFGRGGEVGTQPYPCITGNVIFLPSAVRMAAPGRPWLLLHEEMASRQSTREMIRACNRTSTRRRYVWPVNICTVVWSVDVCAAAMHCRDALPRYRGCEHRSAVTSCAWPPFTTALRRLLWSRELGKAGAPARVPPPAGQPVVPVCLSQ